VTAPDFLQVTHLTKRFGDHFAVRDLTLGVSRGTVLALLGPSGSGKTTTLRLLAGFERPDTGQVLVEGADVTPQAPVARRFGMVFQHYALFPHLNVAENVGFGLGGRAPEARARRVSEVLALVDLAGFEKRQVGELSGGQQQRVAVARALAPEPRVLLLDEPLSNLDPALRERTRRELRQALDHAGVTTVFVTHEQDEAFALADRIAVLRDGHLEQVGTARELYETPATLFVATFVGRASVLRGVLAGPGQARLEAGGTLPVRGAAGVAPGDAVRVVVRPEAARVGDGGQLSGTVTSCRYTGARAYFDVDLNGESLEVEARVDAAQLGERVHVTVDAAHAFPGDR
jgi:ABC-type Fe3+/spermidine/putrescine transport system ATPase subunit